MTSETCPLAIEGVKDRYGQTGPAGRSIKIEVENGVKEEGKSLGDHTTAPENRVVLPWTPAANAGPYRRTRPRDMNAVSPLAPACPADVCGSVTTSRPRPNRTNSGKRGEKSQGRQGRGSERGGSSAQR